MSIPELIRAGDLDTRVAALLWALMDRRASVIIAAMPRLAGKTTLLTAMLDFLPEDTDRIYLRGTWEDFDFLENTEASHGYLLINELSDHLPYYLWDERCRRALELMGEGYGLAGTMHAESPAHTFSQLVEGTGARESVLASLTAVINLEMRRDPQQDPPEEPLRRVGAVSVLEGSQRLSCVEAARWVPEDDRFETTAEGAGVLAQRLEIDVDALSEELESRAAAIEATMNSGSENFRSLLQRSTGPNEN